MPGSDEGSLLRRIGVWLMQPPEGEYATAMDRFATFLCRCTMPLVGIVVIITFYEVVMRYVFRSPTLWVNEMTLWMGGVVFLISGVYAMQLRRHIRITVVYDVSPLWLRKIFDIVTAAVVVGYVFLMIYAGFGVAWETLVSWERLGTYWNPPVPATMKPLVLIAAFLVALQAVSNLLVDTFGWRGFRSGKSQSKKDES